MFTPLNRHIHIDIDTIDPNETDSGILLPDDFKPTQEKYGTATVIASSDDTKFAKYLRKGAQVVIDKSMIEEINFGDKSINVILENYILGIIS